MWLLLLLAVAAVALDITDEEYIKFPRLYHLDDYERCLSHRDGLYCLGTFQLTPVKEPDPTFDMIKEYSQDLHHFNRTLLHRGYCVSSRCPDLTPERNTSLRFERCVALWALPRSLRPSLAKLSYCRSHAQEYARTQTTQPINLQQKLFIFVLITLGILNAVGTIYDIVTGDNLKKNRLLSVWSVRRNWQRLTASYEDGDPRIKALTPIQGLRVLLMCTVVAVHSACITCTVYLDNPKWVEQVSAHPVLMLFLNGSSAVQLFVTLSSFLLTYNVLLYSKQNPLNFRMLPSIIFRRIARISPLHLLVVGYAATWWDHAGSGPMWPASVGAETQICRKKFWAHVFYVNNVAHVESSCLLPTWFLAVDMQLYVVAGALCLGLAHLRARALPILAALIVMSSVLNGVLAYIYSWQSLVYYAYPQGLTTMYSEVSSFVYYYQSSWASLPACLVGLFIAFLHYELQESRVDIRSYKWLNLAYRAAPTAILGWIMSGIYLRHYTADWWVAIYAAVDRSVPSILWAILVLGLVNLLGGWLQHLMSWRGWQPLARLSLAILLVHWCLNLILAASRSAPLKASLLNVVVDFLATIVMSCALAIPLTIMVETPVQKFFNVLMFEISTVGRSTENSTSHNKKS